MRTIILPGYSMHNKKWAYEVQKKLQLDQLILVHEWKHWTKGSLSLSYEISSIMEKSEGDKINIIAKSVGTRVAMHLILKIVNKIEKVILCGIPTKFEAQSAIDLYTKGLKILHAKKILCIQNTLDPFSPYKTVEKAVHSINPEIKIVEKQRNDHEYPYSEDFQQFLKG